ncbi:MAG TPA: FHA domain-containing protein [Actinospica sp.]|nr:FHA domain-containing protein [Actinospica sp.]
MQIEDFAPQVLPASTRRLADGVPSAPPGTLFALAVEGGFAVPPRPFQLHFGRGKGDVHVAIGTHDPYVSRLHGILTCDGREWWLRNEGRLPIYLPDDLMVLSGHELAMEPGYTPLFINTPAHRSYLLEIHIVGPRATAPDEVPQLPTREPDIYELTEDERLVLVVLAQRYLRQERYPQPVSWKQVAEDLNRVADDREWTPKIAAHLVATVRERLAAARTPVPGILRNDGVGEPVGNVLNHNLIRALLKNTTLMPTDLDLLKSDPPE